MLPALTCSGVKVQMLTEDKWEGKEQTGKESSDLQLL